MTVDMMNAPKVREVVSSEPISAHAARDLLSRFLEAERRDIVSEAVDNEVLIRLEAVCRTLPKPSTSTTLASSAIDEKEEKRAKKAAKKAAKKERKKKRKREKEESAKSNKKSKS